MTVSATSTRTVSYAGDGGSGPFPIPFRVLEANDLKAAVVADDGTRTALEAFTVTGAGALSGATVTTAEPIGLGDTLVLWTETALVQPADYLAGDAFPAETHEAALDRLTLIAQDARRDLDRSFKVAIGDDVPEDTTYDALVDDVADAVSAEAISLINAAGAAQAGLVNTSGSTQVGVVNAAGEAQVDLVEDEGDTQVERVEEAGDSVAAVVAAMDTSDTFSTLSAGLTATADGSPFKLLAANLKAVEVFKDVSGSALYLGSAGFGDGVDLAIARMLSRSPLLAPQHIVAPLIDIAPIDAVFTDGRIAPSRSRSRPSRNMVNVQAFLRDPLVTPNYIGDYHRVVLNSSSDVVRFAPLPSGRSVRLTVTVKSTAGAGNQNIQIGRYVGAMVTQAITEGADAVFDATVVGGASGNLALYASSFPVDFLVKVAPIVVEVGEIPPTTDQVKAAPSTLALQSRQMNEPGAFVLSDGGLVGGTMIGRIPLVLGNGNYSMAEGTVMIALRKDGAVSGDGAFGGALFTPNLGNTTYDTITFGSVAGGRTQLAVPGCNGSAAQIPSISGEDYYVLGGRFNTSFSETIAEGVPTKQGTGTGGTPIQFPYLGVGSGYQDTRLWNGLIGPIYVVPTMLTWEEYGQQEEALKAHLRMAGGRTQDQREMIIVCEDSLGNGFPSSTPSIRTACESFARQPKYINLSTNGQSVTTFVTAAQPNFGNRTNQAVMFDLVEKSVAAGWRTIVLAKHGTNNSSATTADLLNTNIWAPARARGAIVIASTIPSSADLTHRPRINSEIVAASSLYDVLCPIHLDANIGVDGAYSNLTYFRPDGIHFEAPGYAAKGAMEATAIAAARAL
jgi:hypothetical protein